MIEVVVPQIGEAVSELQITQWHKKEGDYVKKGDVLFEIESDKSILDVEAFVEGTLVKIIAPDGCSVLPKDIVAYIAPPCEESEELINNDSGTTDIDGGKKSLEKEAPSLGVQNIQLSSIPSERTTRVLASPKAKDLAIKLGIPIENVIGSGVDSMITASDVEKIAQKTKLDQSSDEL